MKESSTYQAIVEEGRQKGRQEGERAAAKKILLRLGRKNLAAPAQASANDLTLSAISKPLIN